MPNERDEVVISCREKWLKENEFEPTELERASFTDGVIAALDYASAQHPPAPAIEVGTLDGWVAVSERLPEERQRVLIKFAGTEPQPTKAGGLFTTLSEGEVVGYLRYAAGDKDSPQFITPGVPMFGRIPTHWMQIPPFVAGSDGKEEM